MCSTSLPSLLPSLPPHTLPPTPSLAFTYFTKNLVSEIVIPEKNITQTKHQNQMSSRQERCLPSKFLCLWPQFPFQFKIAALEFGHCAQSGAGTCKTWHFCPGSGNRHVEKSLYTRIQLLYQKHVLYLGEEKNRQNTRMRI